LIKKRLLITLKFFVLWCAFAYYSGIFEHLHELPRGVHQGAQCDRASLAQNYYYGNFKFLYPEVNEDRCIDGIVSCELPLTPFLSALLYKTFGYDEFWFRSLSFTFFSIGMFGLYLLFRTRMNDLVSFLLVLTLQCSPILMFYAANFIPDISALGLSFLVFFLFFRLHLPHAYLPNFTSRWLSALMILTLSLAIASKTTNAIHWLSLGGLVLFSFVPTFRIKIINRKMAIFSLLIALVIPVGWYFWSKHLGQTHNYQYFMMRIPWSESWESYKTAWLVYLANWPQQTFSEPLIFIVFGCIVLSLFLKKFISNELWFLTLFNFLGSLTFLFVMIEQFKYHDYYIICLFPVFTLSWLSLAEAAMKIPSKFWYLKVLALAAVIWTFLFQNNGGTINLRERYTQGNYWDQSSVKPNQYDTLRQMLATHHIDRNNCVIVGYDPTPNNILYLLHLRGHRYSKEHDAQRLDYIINGAHPQYLISNERQLDSAVNQLVDMQFVLEYHDLKVFKLLHK
jgi:hypothetical protein